MNGDTIRDPGPLISIYVIMYVNIPYTGMTLMLHYVTIILIYILN